MKRNFHFGKGVYHPGARPYKIVVDAHGELWLCDLSVDETKNLATERDEAPDIRNGHSPEPSAQCHIEDHHYRKTGHCCHCN